MSHKLTADDVAFIMEGREQGFTWKALAWASSMHPEALRAVARRAISGGMTHCQTRAYIGVRAKKSPRSESLYAGTEGSYTSPPGNGQAET